MNLQEQQDWARHRMWVDLIPGYGDMTSNQKKHAKASFADRLGKNPHEVHTRKEQEEMQCLSIPSFAGTTVTYNSLAPLTPAACCATESIPCQAKPKKMSKKMIRYHDDDLFDTPVQTQTDETKKRQYLSSRLNEIDDEKYTTLRKQFNMDHDSRPETFADLLERLTTGKYTINEKRKDERFWSLADMLNGGGYGAIEWRDPSKPADHKGFEAANKAKAAAFTKAQDVIAINDPAEGLKALAEFEAWTPTGTAN